MQANRMMTFLFAFRHRIERNLHKKGGRMISKKNLGVCVKKRLRTPALTHDKNDFDLKSYNSQKQNYKQVSKVAGKTSY